MHLKKIRKSTAIVLVGILSIIPLATSKIHADSPNYNDIKNERAIGDYYSWRTVGSRNVGTETKGGWVHFYTGARASRAGEKDVATGNVKVKRELTGNLKVTYKQLEGTLGYSANREDTFSVSKVSASLKKGEYVKAYYMKNYTKNKVTQRQYVTTNGSTYPTSNYAYVYSLKPLMPKIKLEYYGAKTRSETPYKTEIYNADTGALEETIYEK